MTDCRGGWSAKGLDQPDLCILDLIRFRLTTQLDDCLDSLIHAGSATGKSTGFHAAHRGTWDLAFNVQLAVLGKTPSIPFYCKSNGFQR